jgi:hypothetical protein
MSNLVYRIPQEFIRIEALNTRGANQQDAADPIWLNVRTTFRDDVNTEVESVLAGQSDQVWKVQTGLWLFQLTPGKYEAGKAYTAHFRFEMTPGNLNVARKNFVWQPIPDQPHDPDKCIIFGTLMDVAGVPVAEQKLIIEQYSNFITLNHRLAQNTIYSDSFGLWQLELPKNAIVRVVFGDLARVIKVPDQARVALGEIPDYQPESEQRDKYGYPLFAAQMPLNGLIDRPDEPLLPPTAGASTDAETLQGHPAADFALAEHEHTKAEITDLEPISETAAAGTIPLAGQDGKISKDFLPELVKADVTDLEPISETAAAGTIPLAGQDGKISKDFLPELVKADVTDLEPISETAAAGTIPLAGQDGKISKDFLPELVKADVTDLETITATPAAGVVPLTGQDGKLAEGFLPVIAPDYIEQSTPGDTYQLPAEPGTSDTCIIKNASSGQTSIDGNGTLIEGDTTYSLEPGESLTVRFNGTEWRIVAEGDLYTNLEQWVAPPASNASPGVKGQLSCDGAYLYICVATNTWVRSVVSASFS